jgi:hypothetical protein
VDHCAGVIEASSNDDSIVSWLLVIYWGRMLPFVGNAF